MILMLLKFAKYKRTYGIEVQDNLETFSNPMPLFAEGKIFVGRIDEIESQPNSLNLWIVADNFKKGSHQHGTNCRIFSSAQPTLLIKEKATI
jgi:aspartate-semialdehyde dehydrogenase